MSPFKLARVSLFTVAFIFSTVSVQAADKNIKHRSPSSEKENRRNLTGSEQRKVERNAAAAVNAEQKRKHPPKKYKASPAGSDDPAVPGVGTGGSGSDASQSGYPKTH